MTSFNRIGRSIAALALTCLFASNAYAQATRTWVSGVGDDANPCSRTAPCKTFAGAISKTAASGIISVLDSAGFGAVTITKSITIENDGSIGGILNAGSNGVIINAASTDRVVLRGLSIDGHTSGLNGIRFLAGSSLTVERCVINGGIQKGIDFAPSTANASLVVTDSQIHNARDVVNGGAINIAPTGGGSAVVLLDNVQMTRSQFGLKAAAPSKVTVRNSVSSNHDIFGFQATGNGAVMVLDNVTASGNNGAAVSTLSSGIAMISRSLFVNNAIGLTNLGGQIQTFGDNRNFNNTTPGAPTGAVTPQQ
ncbi:hypothetical protein [Tahibacter amnicola]|uniref:Parallel beta helix pectate lyase-like protein n=1 Tax=Tahibacter amnicola TaxID=2976241 RepID=A0ABY6BJ40_9GAMM|nr:hypothetical protein [Tahibacter amnicola]UXI69403.1 hypothetical protein N4264_07070 [Tahibacter amnicola]